MGIIRFAQRVLGIRTQPVRTGPVDPLQQTYADGLTLIARIYGGEPWSRRAMNAPVVQLDIFTLVDSGADSAMLDQDNQQIG